MTIAAASRIRDTLVDAAEADARTHGATLNDLLSGIVATQALYVAAIPEPHRSAMLKTMAKMLLTEIERNIATGVGPTVEAVVIKGGIN